MKFRRRPVKVRILYKNGDTVRLRCEEFTVKRGGLSAEITGFEWKNAKPRPLHVGIDEVAAVWHER